MASFNAIIFWSVAGITAGISLLLSYSIYRFQRKLADRPPINAGDFRDNGVLDFIWTLVPVGILAVLLVLAFQATQL
jgi:heme/copper-type cytochrome/quinol oxidase subunit 2